MARRLRMDAASMVALKQKLKAASDVVLVAKARAKKRMEAGLTADEEGT